MADGKIIFETLLDESGLIKGLDKVEATTGQKLGVIGSAFEKTGGIMSKAFTAPIVAAGTAFMATAEKTREYRTEMGKLEAAFTTAGFSVEAAKGAYEDIYAVLGEEDTSVEAANHLAQLTDNEKDLATWTGDILPGVFTTFGDSLPLEGLTEAANETAKVGQVTGPLADALNWAGVSEDAFNEKLAACSTEQERQALITETLNDLYGDASDRYKQLNGDVMEANKAQAKLTDAISRIGAVAEPVMTMLKDRGADLLNVLAALIESFASAPGWVQGLVLGFVGLLTAAGPLLVIFGKLATGLGNIMDFSARVQKSLAKKAAAMAADTAATAANTAATTTNATATNLAAKAKLLLNKALVAGKWLLIGTAIAAATALLVAFVKDSDAATAMVQNFSSKIVEMVGKFTNMLPQIVEGITTMLPVIINAGVDILMALMQGLVQAIPTLVAAIPQIITAIVTAITNNLPMIIEAAIQVILALMNGLLDAIPQLVDAIPTIITAIFDAVINNLPTIIQGALQIILALASGLIKYIPKIVTQLPKIIKAIVNGLIGMLGQIFDTGVSILKKLWSGISSWVSSLYSKVSGFAKKLPGKIKNGIGSLFNTGVNWLKGLWNGISSKVDWVIGKVKGIGSSILDGIKGIFKEHSPSRATMEIGEYFSEGLGIGIINKMKSVRKNVNREMKNMLSDVSGFSGMTFTSPVAQLYGARFSQSASLAGENAATATPINQTINFYQPVETPHETARAIKNMATYGLAGAGGVR